MNLWVGFGTGKDMPHFQHLERLTLLIYAFHSAKFLVLRSIRQIQIQMYDKTSVLTYANDARRELFSKIPKAWNLKFQNSRILEFCILGFRKFGILEVQIPRFRDFEILYA